MEIIIVSRALVLAYTAIILSMSTCTKSKDLEPADSLPDFENKLSMLMLNNNIPGMIGGINRDGVTIWSKPYGFADKESGKPVTESTLFHLASLTKTFGALTIMQLVQKGLVDLNDPVSNYGITITSTGTIRVKHLLSHSSEGTPGTYYSYNGDRFALLDKVIKNASGLRFDRLLLQEVLIPKGLVNIAPNLMDLAAGDGYDTALLRSRMVQGYSSNGNQRLAYPLHFSCAAGLVANGNDMLKYSDAIDDTLLLKTIGKNQMFSSFTSNSGQELPYGYGWFVQTIGGKKILWHYGLWTGISSLIIKVPEKNISFILLANNDMLSKPYNLGGGNLLNSPFANLFLSSFVLDGAKL